MMKTPVPRFCPYLMSVWLSIPFLLQGVYFGPACIAQDQQASTAHPLTVPEFLTKYDLDTSGGVTVEELYGAAQDDDGLFIRTDGDCSGILDLEELGLYGDLVHELDQSAIWWKQRPVLQKRFSKLDLDQSQSLSPEEWLQGIPEERQQRLAGDLRLNDRNGDGSLSFEECLSTERFRSTGYGPGIPDPIQERIEEVWSRLAQRFQLEACDTRSLSEPEVLQVLREEMPYIRSVTYWDRDGNRQLDRRELRLGLEVAAGIRHPRGLLLRHPQGRVFNLKTFSSMDVDQNQELSREEFITKYWAKDQAEAKFTAVDLDQDQILSLEELLHPTTEPLLWIDNVSDFRKLDKNGDLGISREELLSGAKSYEMNMATQTFPAFDLDGNGSLSLHEYRLTPMGCPVLDWNWIRSDTDFDGKLSVEEYHSTRYLYYHGLSWLQHQCYDRNGDGTLSPGEYLFRVSWPKLSPQAAFVALDQNEDQSLTLEEYLKCVQVPGKENQESALQKRLAQLEDAFYASDLDQNKLLENQEYLSQESPALYLVAGKRMVRPAEVITPPQEGWSTRSYLIVLFNVIALAGVGWMVLRK